MRWCRRAECYQWMLHLAMALVILKRLTGGRSEYPRLNWRRDHGEDKGWKKAPRCEHRKIPLHAWGCPALPDILTAFAELADEVRRTTGRRARACPIWYGSRPRREDARGGPGPAGRPVLQNARNVGETI